MADRVATGEVYIALHDEGALSGLRRIERDFDRTMDKIDRREAEAKISVDSKAFESVIAKAQQDLDEFEKKRAAASGAEKKRLDDQVAAQKEYVAALKQRVAAQGKSTEAERKANAELKATAARIDAIHMREKQLEDLRKRAHNAEKQRLKAEAALQEKAADRRARELSDRQKLQLQMEKEYREVPKLEARYARLTDTLEKLAQAKRKISRRDDAAMIRVEIEEAAVMRDLDDLRQKIHARTGRDPIAIPVKAELGREWGRELRIEFDRQGGSVSATAAAVGLRVGRSMGTKINVGVRDTLDRGLSRTVMDAGGAVLGGFGRTLLSGFARLGHAAGGLADMTVRLGPFTASIKQAFIGLSLLAPMLVDVAGAAGAFVGSLGAATLGVGALGVGIVGGAIPAFAGMGFVIADVVKEFSAIRTAQKAYDDAIRKGNTDLAKDKMKELQATMGNVSKETVRQVGLMSTLGDRFDRLTQPAHAAVFETIGEGLKTASDLMPMFAENTNDAMQAASNGVNKWMQSLRTAEAENILDTMMDNFSSSLGPALSGLGDLAGYLGKVGAAASDHLPNLARTFKDWADGLNDMGMDEIEDKVDGVIRSARTMGRFFLSAGRLVKSFFGGGVEAGDEFVQTMTDAMDAWRRGFETPAGQESLANFFSEAVAGAKSLYNALAPIISSFVGWARAISPFARMFFDAAGAVAGFAQSLLEVTALRAPITALVTTLGALWAVGKIRGATTAIAGFAGALTGLGRQQTTLQRAAGVAGARGALIPVVPAATVTGYAKAGTAIGGAARNVGTLSRVASAAKTGLSGLGAATLGLSNPIAGAAVGAAALAGGIYLLANRTSDWEHSLEDSYEAAARGDEITRQLDDSNLALAQGYIQSEQAALGVEDAQQTVNQLRRQGAQGTDEYKMAQLNLNAALLEQQRLEDLVGKSIRQQRKATQSALDERTAAYETASASVKELGEMESNYQNTEEGIRTIADLYGVAADEAERTGRSLEEVVNESSKFSGDEEDILGYADALRQAGITGDALARVQRRAALESLNQQRAMQGLGPIAKNAGAAIDFLNQKLGKKKTQEIGVKFKGADEAARVAQQASKSLKQGVPKSVTTRILAKSDNADQAVRKLQNAKITPKKLEIIEKGGDKAIRTMEQIIGKKLTPKQQRILESGGDNTLQKLRALTGIKLPNKKQIVEESGSDGVKGKVQSINSMELEDKRAQIDADASGAISAANAAQAAINAVQSKSVTVTVNVAYPNGRPPNNARGAPTGSAATDRGLAIVGEGSDWMGAKEHLVNARTGIVSTVDEATIMPVSKDTAVIPTEPKYRDRGRSIFKQVARDLGLPTFAKGTPNIPDTGTFPGMPGDPSFDPSAGIDADSRFHKSKGKAGAIKTRRGWADYIDYLHTQQGNWENEISIRESQVKIPEEMVIRDPANDSEVVDPVTGEKTQIEAFKPNPEIEDSYKPALREVLKAMDQLLKIIAELVRAIPEAILAVNQEIDFRGAANKRMTKKIGEHKTAIKKAPNNDAGDKQKAKHQEAIQKLQGKIGENNNVIDTLTDDRKTLKEDRDTAGFDYRQNVIDRADVQSEHDSAYAEALGDANQQMTDQVPKPGSGGGGSTGSGAGGISYGEQASLADTEKANVLKQFGSNFNPNVGGAQPLLNAANVGGVKGAPLGGIAGGVGVTTGQDSVQGTFGGVAADLQQGSPTAGSAAAAGAVAAPARTTGRPDQRSAPGGTTVEKNVTINNTFATVPPDPHTWAMGTEFEIDAAL